MPGTEHLDQFAPSSPMDREDIPNIDVGPLFAGNDELRGQVIEQVRAACIDPGFFYIHNTCISDSTIGAALEAMKDFFESPDQGPLKQNAHNRHAGEMKGWGPMFNEPAYQKGTIAHVESFDIGQQLSAEQYKTLGIEPNIWPDFPGFKLAALEYYEKLTCLGRAISGVFSEILGEDMDFINDRSQQSAPRTMRMLHYPAKNSQLKPSDVGISAHTDFECFTVMNQTAEGLELTNTKGEWYQAPADIGSFTVILGDMLERFSNGQLKATGHRVSVNPWTRYSIVLFFAVDGSYVVEPLSRFVSETRPPRYEAVSQAGHIENELRRASANTGVVGEFATPSKVKTGFSDE